MLRTFLLLLISAIIVFAIVASSRATVKHHWSIGHASWYYDAGGTACGFHRKYGVAHKTLPCGTSVRMCKVRCVTAVVQDRGPFIAGREFDLNPALKAALGCGDICTLHYRVLEEHPRKR